MFDGNHGRDQNGEQSDGDYTRDRALLFALTITFMTLVVAKIVLGLYWYGAVLFAAVVFGLTFALLLRLMRNSR